MPTPIGHGLAGLAAGWAVAGPAEGRRAQLAQAVLFIAAGAAPDLDILIKYHRHETHSIGAAVIAGVVATLVRYPVATTRWQIFWSVTAAWATHPLIDMLALDNWPPIGVMAFWPFSREFYETGLNIFLPVARNIHSAVAMENDVWAALREIVILAPIVALVWWIRTSRSRTRARSSVPGVPR
jgi:membrane-bound metal-dependent hydrolase YbcI (DUF457 family)